MPRHVPPERLQRRPRRQHPPQERRLLGPLEHGRCLVQVRRRELPAPGAQLDEPEPDERACELHLVAVRVGDHSLELELPAGPGELVGVDVEDAEQSRGRPDVRVVVHAVQRSPGGCRFHRGCRDLELGGALEDARVDPVPGEELGLGDGQERVRNELRRDPLAFRELERVPGVCELARDVVIRHPRGGGEDLDPQLHVVRRRLEPALAQPVSRLAGVCRLGHVREQEECASPHRAGGGGVGDVPQHLERTLRVPGLGEVPAEIELPLRQGMSLARRREVTRELEELDGSVRRAAIPRGARSSRELRRDLVVGLFCGERAVTRALLGARGPVATSACTARRSPDPADA